MAEHATGTVVVESDSEVLDNALSTPTTKRSRLQQATSDPSVFVDLTQDYSWPECHKSTSKVQKTPQRTTKSAGKIKNRHRELDKTGVMLILSEDDSSDEDVIDLDMSIITGTDTSSTDTECTLQLQLEEEENEWVPNQTTMKDCTITGYKHGFGSTSVGVSSLSQATPLSLTAYSAPPISSLTPPISCSALPIPFTSKPPSSPPQGNQLVTSVAATVEKSTTPSPALPSDLPSWWSSCTKCSDCHKMYHLIELSMDTTETQQIISDFIKGSFEVVRIQRIQNPTLWRRYAAEKACVLAERGQQYDLNEVLLYHTSRAAMSTICAEGLDMRLSRSGNFGRGIYFSDLPGKCDCYNSNRCGVSVMYACKVILGDVKMYQSGACDPTLVREPPKETSGRPGGGGEGLTYYDSVMGFIAVGDEYIIYNNYRALPQYVVEYKIASKCRCKSRRRKK